MAWTAPFTAVASTVLTAAQLNTNLRDNLNQTGPALVSAAGQILVSTAANALAARTLTNAVVATSDTTTSTSFADLTSTVGPTVTVTTGTAAVVLLYASLLNSVGTNNTYAGFEISGATTLAASDATAASTLGSPGGRTGLAQMQTGLTPGSNTFKMKYRVNGGTGTYLDRRLAIIPL